MTTADNDAMNQLGEPDAGKPHVRFDERGVETGLSPTSQPHPKKLAIFNYFRPIFWPSIL